MKSGADIVMRTSRTDNYSTPKSAVEALLDRVVFRGTIWEPAAGLGNIVQVLEEREYPYQIVSSDIRDLENVDFALDFLSDHGTEYPNIITNPPFSLAQAFAEKALKSTEASGGMVALLLRIQFLEGQRRKAFLQSSPLEQVLVFSRRISMYPETWKTNRKRPGGTQCFAWFVWNHMYLGPGPVIGWI